MIERVDGDVNNLGAFFSTFTSQIVGSFLLLVGILVLLYREEWRAGLGFTLFVLFSVTVLLLQLRNISVPYWRARSKVRADMFGFLEERLAGTEDIRSANAQPLRLAPVLRADAHVVEQRDASRPGHRCLLEHERDHLGGRERGSLGAGCLSLPG